MRFDESLDHRFRVSPEWELDIGAGDIIPLLRKTPSGKSEAFSFSGNERNRLFISSLGKQFLDLSNLSGADLPQDGRAFCLLDYDQDGWLDIVTVNANSPAFRLLRNRIGELLQKDQQGNSVRIKLTGGNQRAEKSKCFSNRNGYGAVVIAKVGTQRYQRVLTCGAGFASQNTTVINIGIGNASIIDELTIQWPSGKRQSIQETPAGSFLEIVEPH